MLKVKNTGIVTHPHGIGVATYDLGGREPYRSSTRYKVYVQEPEDVHWALSVTLYDGVSETQALIAEQHARILIEGLRLSAVLIVECGEKVERLEYLEGKLMPEPGRSEARRDRGGDARKEPRSNGD